MAGRTWIFQANPTRFDVDGWFATKPVEFLWRTPEHYDEVAIGDQVFIWKAIGDGDRKLSGVIAESEVVEAPKVQPDDPLAKKFWRGGERADSVEMRTKLLMKFGPDSGKFLSRDFLSNNSYLQSLSILKNARGRTNFDVTAVQSNALDSL